MTVRQLINRLKKVDPKQEVFFENRVNPCGNINDLVHVKQETCGFFGKSEPCVILRGFTP